MTIDTKPLSERLRACIDTTSDDLASNCISALDAKDALLREAEAALQGVIISRLKPDFDRARSLLLKLTEATKP